MREIKFRAWDTDNNLFVICEDHQIRQINNDYAGLGNRYIYQQYTGQKDKNGKEIYEGDIIKYYNHRFEKPFIHEVMYDVKYTSFSIPNIEPEEGIEVIGNIYETPELLTHDR